MAERPLETGWLPDTPAGDNLVRQFVLNQADLNDALARAMGGRHDAADGVRLATGRSSVPFYNQALLTRPVLDAGDRALDAVAAFFEGGPPATLLSVWPLPDLAGRGWRLVGHPVFVALPASRAAPTEPPPTSAGSVTVTAVAEPADLAAAESGVVGWYPLPEAQGAAPGSVLPATLLGGPMELYLARLDGVPAGAAARHVAHGVVNLCLGATDPAARRRGVWSALVAARRSGHEHLPTVAFTSDDSRPGFVRMGYLPVQRFTMWLIP